MREYKEVLRYIELLQELTEMMEADARRYEAESLLEVPDEIKVGDLVRVLPRTEEFAVQYPFYMEDMDIEWAGTTLKVDGSDEEGHLLLSDSMRSEGPWKWHKDWVVKVW